MLDDALFEPEPELPDLELLLWKVLHDKIGYTISYDETEQEMLVQLWASACPICTGSGQDGMYSDGAPRVCKTCQGRGK